MDVTTGDKKDPASGTNQGPGLSSDPKLDSFDPKREIWRTSDPMFLRPIF